MIPTGEQSTVLWDTFALPDVKRVHCRLVADVSVWFAERYKQAGVAVNIRLLEAAALLHDIDKAVPKHPGERHPDAAVRILLKEGMPEVADVVMRHSLHAILSADTTPQTAEQRLLYLADKIVKQEVIGVDERFRLWRSEQLPVSALSELERAYPKVKALEKKVYDRIGVSSHAEILLAPGKK